MVSDEYVGPFQKSGDFGWSLPVILILFSSSVVGYLVVVFFATQFGPLPAEGTRRLAGYFAIVGAAMGLTLPLSMRMRWPLKLVSGLTAGTAAGAAAWTLMTMVSHY